MDDVSTIRSENANLRRIQSRLLQWDNTDNPLAPLSKTQTDIVYTLAQVLAENTPEVAVEEIKDGDTIQYSLQEFMECAEEVDREIAGESDKIYLDYHEELQNQNGECEDLLLKIDSTLNILNDLTSEYEFVSTNTSSLHNESEKLIEDQKKLIEINAEVTQRLHYFLQVDHLLQKLESPTLSVNSDNFWIYMDEIDAGLAFLHPNKKFKDSQQYIAKYRQCVTKACNMIKNYVSNILLQATDQVSKHNLKAAPNSDTAFALYYGKFKAFAPKVKFVTDLIETRIRSQTGDYGRRLLEHLNQIYINQRNILMIDGVELAIKDLTVKNKSDHCALIRHSCSFLVNICLDEYKLFYEFFPSHDDQLTAYLEGFCNILYDNLRPCIIHINHLETLAEICSILRVEMLEEHVQHNAESLEAFGTVMNQLCQDAQERLVFRANIYLQSDILNYKPSPGDLAYPEKLEMMEKIALSLKENAIQRADSRASMMSLTSSHENPDPIESHSRTRIESSPADLHGMWYPTVRRTLVCLSRLYRCVDRSIFQGLSQEALTYCVESVCTAGALIREQKSVIDGELFEIKHLLILREQIAPFRVNFTVKETSLDFSKVKTAAFGLLQKRKQLFSLGTNNALLEFLIEGSPQVNEKVLDSRKDVDRQLKNICEAFIKDATNMFVGSILKFMDKYNQMVKEMQGKAETQSNIDLHLRKWGSPQIISGIVQEAQRNIKSKLSGLQRSMQLYLANKDTEFILFRPIRNNIIGTFLKLEQLITTNTAYTKDDFVIAAIPSADQLSLLINASVLSDSSSIPEAV